MKLCEVSGLLRYLLQEEIPAFEVSERAPYLSEIKTSTRDTDNNIYPGLNFVLKSETVLDVYGQGFSVYRELPHHDSA